MRNLFILLLLSLSACSNITKLALYDIEIENTEGINGFTSTEIFSKGGGDEVWGMDDEKCNPFSFSAYDASVDYSKASKKQSSEKTDELEEKIKGKYTLPIVKVKDRRYVVKNSIHLKSSKKNSCEWIGMGIGWDGWQGKDISYIMEDAAIEMLVRVEKGSISNLPIVFILEDYSENQCYATTNYLGIEGGEITTKWTKVIVPLQSFSYNTNKVNLTNIKQLLMQCYDATDVFIDNMKIIEYSSAYKKLENNLTVFDSLSPVSIFQDSLVGNWGVNKNACSNFKHIKDSVSSPHINIKIDTSFCNWKSFGFSWNNWKYTDISTCIKEYSLSFSISSQNFIPFNVYFEDYSGKKLSYLITKSMVGDNNNWTGVSIPLYLFPIRKSEVNTKEIKQIVFEFENKTNIKLDNILLTKK